MDAESVLALVDKGSTTSDLVAFRYAKARALTSAALYALVGLAVLVVAILLSSHVNKDAGGVVYGAGAVAALIVLSALWRALKGFLDFRDGDTNLLVVTREGVIRRLRGKVRAWPFTDFPDLTIVTSNQHTGTKVHSIQLRSGRPEGDPAPTSFSAGSIESIHLNEAGASFQHELVDDGSFGPMHEIARAIVELGMRR
jgi:hypothetical protein